MADNDVQLIQRILDGDDEAFTAIMQKYQERIHAFALQKVGDHHAAEEITQDTFILVHEKLYQLKDPKRFEDWVNVIAKNLCMKWVRTNLRQ